MRRTSTLNQRHLSSCVRQVLQIGFRVRCGHEVNRGGAELRSITSRAAKGEYVVPSESERQQLAAILQREPFYKNKPEDLLPGLALSLLI